MKKSQIIYDASIVVNTKKSHWRRSGVYFAAINILKELAKRDDIELTLYCKTDSKKQATNTLKTLLKKDIKCIFDLDLSSIKEKAKYMIDKFPKPLAKPFYILHAMLKKARSKPTTDATTTQNQACFAPQNTKTNKFFLTPIFIVPKRFRDDESICKYAIAYALMPILFPQYYENSSESWRSAFMSFDNYFAISEHTRNDFLKHLAHLKPENITTALLACDESFKPASIGQIKSAKSKYNIPENKKYIFSLCTLEPRKNLIRTVRTFIDFIKKHSIDDLVFVLGGAHWEKFIKELEKSINDLGSFKDKILKIGYVDDEDLAALYSGAEFFVYTSQYEGFGLPPLEAMSCGAAVITSDNSSLPEVVGDAGIMIPYDSDEAHIKAYEDYYFNPQLKEANAKKGLEQAKKFSWEKCVNIMVEKMKEDIARV